MADFTALKTAIQNAIKQNGNEEITGAILQEVMLAVVNTLGDSAINDLVAALSTEVTNRQNADGTLQSNINAEQSARQLADSTLQSGINNERDLRVAADNAMQSAITAISNHLNEGYIYVGIATTATNPSTPVGKVFYIAVTAGTYTNFLNSSSQPLVLTQGINILKYNGTAWSVEQVWGVDNTPTPSSNNLVKSGGVFNDIMTNGSAFDLSAYNDGTTYAELNAALTALNALPAAYKKGGMSLKYVQSSDNNYTQFRCIADEFTTDTNYWVISEEGSPINNPNYIRVWIDANEKFLWGIKSNGDIVFGVGVPSQIKEYILNLVETMSLEDVNDIVAFLDGFINSGVTLSELLNKKADIEKLGNATFIQATTDKDSRLLEGRKSDGTKVICGDIELDKMSMIQIENYTYISVSTDKNGKIILGVKHDGTVFIPKIESRSIDGIIPIKVNSNNENKEVNDFTTTQGLTWNAVGTSVTQGYTRDGQAGSESITPYLYVAQVANELGLQANNYGVGATTICKNMKSGAVVDFHVLNSSIVERVCGLNGNTPYPDADIWTIEGAPNDIFYNSEIGSIYSTKDDINTVYGALKRIIEEIQGRSNNPRIMLIYWAFTKYEKDNEYLAYEIEKAFTWASNYYGVPMLNLRRESGLSPYNIYRLSIGDGVHPSADGTNMYKHKIAKFISNNI